MSTRLTFTGLKELLLAARPNTGSADIAAIRARALLQPPESATTKRRGRLAEFLKQVSLFEDLGHWDLVRVARIVHEREYGDGEYICEEGRPGAALFVVRRGVVEVVKRGANRDAVPPPWRAPASRKTLDTEIRAQSSRHRAGPARGEPRDASAAPGAGFAHWPPQRRLVMSGRRSFVVAVMLGADRHSHARCGSSPAAATHRVPPLHRPHQ